MADKFSALADSADLARQLIQVESVTPDQGAAVGLASEWLESLGFQVRRLPFGAGAEAVDNLYARLGAGAPHLCYAGHLDVVPAGAVGAWSSPPFAGAERDGMLIGRGAVDMKGGIACFIAAVAGFLAEKKLKSGALPKGSLSFLLTGDEEGAAKFGTKKVMETLVQEGETWSHFLVGEPTSVARLGDTVKIGRRGSLNLEISVRGQQGHVAYPQFADNAIHRLNNFVAELLAEPLDEGSEHFEPSTLQISRIGAGNQAWNVVPAEAWLVLNIRYNELHTAESLEKKVQDLLAKHAPESEMKAHRSGDSFVSPKSEFLTLLLETIKDKTGETAEISTGGGISDARFLWQAAPCVEFGLVGKTMHQVDEAVPLSELKACQEIYFDLLCRYFS